MLVNMNEILKDAREKNYAVGCINTPNLETLKAVIGAAEEVNAPIIIDHAEVHDSMIPLETIAPLMVEYAKNASVPVCVHLDHGKSYSFVMRAIRNGFTSIMYDCSELSYEENEKNLTEFVKIAHDLDITVEGELGVLFSSDDDDSHGGVVMEGDASQYYTNPELAVKIAESTGVDALAINFGTLHGTYKAEPKLDFDRVKEITSNIRKDCSVVMHGASGVSFPEIKKAIDCGISKINYYTYMSTSVSPKIADFIASDKNPKFYHDIALFAQKEMQAYCVDVIKTFMNGKKADF